MRRVAVASASAPHIRVTTEKTEFCCSRKYLKAITCTSDERTSCFRHSARISENDLRIPIIFSMTLF